jgi:light-regulated signal transduction histidine kinase (bacteriophytochrome)
METIDLSRMAVSVADRLKGAHPDRDVEFLVTGDLHDEGDRNLLAVVLENLLENGWKFTRKRAHAVIEFGRTRLPDGTTPYFVKDNGIGFDMAYAGKLFKPFQRLHSPGEFPGTGIGLATVKRIVNRHGGRVWIEGEESKGTTVYFTLAQPSV